MKADLAQLNQAKTIKGMDIPTLRLHELKGNWQGTWAVTVQSNWNGIRQLANGDAEVIDYEDYH